MRIQVNFKTTKIPIYYRRRLMGLIKEALRESDRDFKEYFFYNKDQENLKTRKPFFFGISMHSSSFHVSSSNHQFLLNLYYRLIRLKGHYFNEEVKLHLENFFYNLN